jgi:hypothetical protein
MRIADLNPSIACVVIAPVPIQHRRPHIPTKRLTTIDQRRAHLAVWYIHNLAAVGQPSPKLLATPNCIGPTVALFQLNLLDDALLVL